MIYPMKLEHLKDVVSIHSDAFPDSYLTQLGPNLLRLLYKDLSKYGFGYVYIYDNEVVGFLAGIYSSAEDFYGYLIKNNIFRLPIFVIFEFLRKPKIIGPSLERLKRLIKKGGKPKIKATDDYYEIMQSNGLVATALTLATNPTQRRKGVAKQLWSYLLHDQAKKEDLEAIIGSVQESNETVNKFYNKMGYKIIARVKRGYQGEEIKWLFYRKGYCTLSEDGKVTWL
jgi:ribosomal protein S18 acetylase RimI-like enzyme